MSNFNFVKLDLPKTKKLLKNKLKSSVPNYKKYNSAKAKQNKVYKVWLMNPNNVSWNCKIKEINSKQ